MKRIFCFFLLFVFLLLGGKTKIAPAEERYEMTPVHNAFRAIQPNEVKTALENLHSSPRLLLTEEAIANVQRKISLDPRWKLYYEALKQDADKRMDLPPVKYELTGVRLLSVSREALKRIFAWSFLYRFTGENKYAQRVEKETVAISEFSDWHPQHFLDVAEMTVAVAIGYDSCKDFFTSGNREKVRKAIFEKGVLEVRYNKGWWKRNTANWNQVCWCGNLFGALAVYDDESVSNQTILEDAILDSVNGVTWSMSSYEPDGNYTEGPGYWGYGTGFNILMLGALESALNTTFDRSESLGLLKSINYYEHVFGTTGNAFNYPDSGGGKMFEATAFWYSAKLNDPNIVWNENMSLNTAFLMKIDGKNKKGARAFESLIGDRVAVCALLWGPTLDAETIDKMKESFGANLASTAPKELGYVGLGNGLCSVALFRTAWDSKAAYLGVKCGRPSAPHGHLDEGGFVYDDKGVRWIVELGPESYHAIESRGMNLWNMTQNSDRWKLLRYNNYGHSVPTINGALQLVDETTTFAETKIGSLNEESSVTIDLTPVYKNEIAKVIRKITLRPNGDLVVEDSFDALADKAAKIERRFLTPAQVEVDAETALMSLRDPNDSNSKLQKIVKTQCDKAFELNVIPCASENDFDSPNPGVSILIQTVQLKPGENTVCTTTFVSK